MRKTNKMGTGTKIVLVLCLIVFCGSGYYLADYFLNAHRTQQEFAQLGEDDGAEKEGRDLSALYQKNPDLVGWVKVKGTRIDYPVMQTGREGQENPDPEYYLHRNFEKEYSDAGTPFMDAASDIGLPTCNWLIYGHHMKSGIMFHDLVKYEDREFYENHPTFKVSTVHVSEDGAVTTDTGTYQIIAACYSKIYSDDADVFKYYEYPGITTEDEFNSYVSGVKSLSVYDTEQTARFGEQLVTLSTCAYQTEDGRFFVVGKRIR